MGSSLFRRIALFSGIILAGSTLPDIFRFIEGKEWLGHSPLIPVLVLCVVAVAYWIGQIAKCFLKEEAMICPLRKDCPVECIRKQPHPKSYLCSVPGCYGTSCVSYIPEEHKEYDIDNEPVFPICGTCNARKNLDDKRIEQINSTDKIEIFIDGKKTVFVREGKKKEGK